MQPSVLRISFGAVALVSWLLASSCARCQPPGLPNPPTQPGFLATYTVQSGSAFQRVESHIALDAASRPALIATDDRVRVRYRAELATPSPGQYRFLASFAGDVAVTVNSAVVLTGSSDAGVTNPTAAPTAPDSDRQSTGTTVSLASQPIEIAQPTVTIDVEYSQPVSAAPHLMLYWSGPDFGVEPLSADVARASAPDEHSQLLSEGHELFRLLRCYACHSVERERPGTAPSTSPPPAPSLAQTPLPIHRQWLVNWLSPTPPHGADEHDITSDTANPAPHPRWALSNDQAAAISAALLDNPQRNISRGDATQGDPAHGRHLLLTIGCLACHRLDQLGIDAPWSGPDLTQLARKRPRGFVARWLDNPAAINADHRMPRFPLAPTEIADLAAYLETSTASISPADDQARSPAPESPDHVALGHQLLAEHCAACHRLPPGTGDRPQAERRRPLRDLFAAPIRWERSCWTAPTAANRPHYTLTQQQQNALRTYLEWTFTRQPTPTGDDLEPVAPTIHSATILREHRCGACHHHQSLGGDYRTVAEEVARTDPNLAGYLPSMLPPSLRTAGDKFLDSKWDQWLHDSPPRRRPWLKIRMPAFHLTPEQSASVRQFFVLRDRVPDAILQLADPSPTDHGPRPTDPSLAPTESVSLPESSLQDASQLVTAQGFGCLSCHEIGGVRPAAASLTALGPSLTGLGQHVRPTWFRRWLANPARLVPNIEMPAIQRPVPQILGGELEPQVNLIWTALNDPAFQPPTSAIVRTVWRSGVAAQREPPIMLTDCLKLPAGMLIHPALCALPNQHNVLIDLDQGHLAAWWTGPAAQQRTAGKSWFWEPAASQYLISSGPATELVLVTSAGQLAAARQGQFVAALDRWTATPQQGLQVAYRLLCSRNGQPVRRPPVGGPFPEPLDDPRANEDSVDPSEAFQVHIDQQIQPAWPPAPHTETLPSDAAAGGNTQHDSQIPSGQEPGNGEQNEIEPEEGESVPSGFDRTVTVIPSAPWPGSELRWYLSPAATAVLRIESRSVMWTSSRATVEVVEPADGQLASDERGHYVRLKTREGQRHPVRLLLRYRAHVAQRQPVLTDVAPAAPQLDTLDGIPGFVAHRLPLDDRWMPTAMAWSPAGQLFVTSLKGNVWRVTDTDGDGWEDQSQPVSDELAAPYGIVAGDNYLDVVHKSALVRLTDGDHDGRYESAQTLASGWGHTDDYHDWTIGLLPDDLGGYYVATACQQDERPPAAAQWRGRVLHLRPRQPTADDPRQLAVHVVSAGHRFPMGLVRYDEDSLLVTDNQGNFNPFNELNHVQIGRRFGFLNRWELAKGLPSDETTPAVCLPHPWTRSVNGIAWLPEPWTGQLVGCEYDTRRLIRISLEKIDDTLQGAAYPLSIAPADPTRGFLGPVCCAVSPTGDLYIGGMRDSGWGGGHNTGELVRLKFAPERLPLGIAQVTARTNGFFVEFTQPVKDAWLEDTDTYQIESYFRVSTPAYGGDDQDRRVERVTQVRANSEGRGVELTVENLRPGRVYTLRLNIADPTGAESIFPAEAHYTLHRIPR